jgi:nicotinamide-nucleotide amidase
MSLEEEIGRLLKKHKLTLAIAESATGGLLTHLITNVSGSSEYCEGGMVTYSNRMKKEELGVKEETLKKHGAVSSQVAEEMASGIRRKRGVDIALSTTGIAGPTGATPGKPVGLFYIGFSSAWKTISKKYQFQGTRLQNKQSAVDEALSILKHHLFNYYP